ncbi:glycosyltransferase family 2 protein [Flavobacterium zepuense]|uniref:Glycosyltransferase family 2 protein n=1 Tax=Flavobacterium zepuense TaxID=2593302 RepID=A0A552V2W1_9FLAO|nr:glycosyltransferase family 2 protein [Flavobacterium zepuense]TRW24803.1 glycosyltransferase family 2 protein [Flavobacterium zepuense]
MQLSVIILNYNVRYFLEQCVLSVKSALQGIDGEIIVVDNNSADDSCAMMRERFPDVQLIQNNENTGFPKGNNIGVAAAKGEFICILNPDTVVAEDTFTKALEFAKGKEKLGVIGAKLIDGRGKFLPESKMGVPTPWVAITKIARLYRFFPNTPLFNKCYAMHIGKNQTAEVDIIVGAFMIMKRSVYDEVGGFDENYFMYIEDIDLSYTILEKGMANYYFPQTAVIHYKGESTVKDGTYMKRFKNGMQLFYKKHFSNSIFFNAAMRLGTLFFMVTKTNSDLPAKKPQHYILFSQDESLKNAIEEKLIHKVERHPAYHDNILAERPHSQSEHTEIILDNDLLTFGEIIAIMERFKENEYTYKIKPAGTNYILGSNSSNDRGEVVKLQNYSVPVLSTYEILHK